MGSEYDSGYEDCENDWRMQRKTQYGVQIVWADPVAAGAVLRGEEDTYEAKWHEFDSIEAADRFADYYVHSVGGDPLFGGVKEINRATRWALEEYGEWEA
jgi:hypothetical protein